jgi:prepilin-type processing-associated H-X9-DG protein
MGTPHRGKANILFMDGVCRLVNPWADNVSNPYNQSLPMATSTVNPLLDDFMVDSRKWDKNRVIPFP